MAKLSGLGGTDVGRSTDGIGPTGNQRVGSKWIAAAEAELNGHSVYETSTRIVGGKGIQCHHHRNQRGLRAIYSRQLRVLCKELTAARSQLRA